MGSERVTRREKALRALRKAADEVRSTGVAPDDGAEVRRALASACDSEGISPQEYDAIIQGDDELRELQQSALEEGITGGADPGPYAAISRESMSGKPGDLSKSRWNPDPPMRGANRG
jgi:hypothetical protein